MNPILSFCEVSGPLRLRPDWVTIVSELVQVPPDDHGRRERAPLSVRKRRVLLGPAVVAGAVEARAVTALAAALAFLRFVFCGPIGDVAAMVGELGCHFLRLQRERLRQFRPPDATRGRPLLRFAGRVPGSPGTRRFIPASGFAGPVQGAALKRPCTSDCYRESSHG